MPGTLAYRARMEVYEQERTIVDHTLGVVRRKASGAASRQTLAKAHRELDELKGIVERGRHRMDERALEERVKNILRRRWLKDVITVEHDLAAGTLHLPHRPGRGRPHRRARMGQADHLHRPRRVDRRGDRRRLPRPVQGRERLPPETRTASSSATRPTFHWTDQKLKVHGFYCTIALMIVSLIERQIRHAGIHHDGLPLGAKLAMRLLNEIDEVTLIYPPAGGRQGRPRVTHDPRRPRRHPTPALRGAPATAARAPPAV